jgi:signal peptidase I
MKRLGIVASVAAAATGLARAAFLVVSVEGESMIPTYRPGDAVLIARRWITSPVRPGDVVLCRLPAGVPGPDGYLVKRVTSVVSGQVVLHGDGPRSYDSRVFGPIPVECVLGRVVARLTPPGSASYRPPHVSTAPDPRHAGRKT